MRKSALPDALSLARIPLGAALLLTRPFTPIFYAVYIAAGVTDMLDGFAARRMGVAGERGARIDTIADTFFILCVLIRLLPALRPAPWVIVWICAIAALKLFSAIYCAIKYRNILAHHSYINKATGLCLFAYPLIPFSVPAAPAFLCALATAAALEELIRVTRWKTPKRHKRECPLP